MISDEAVFGAVRRGYTDLESASNDEICDYFESIDTSSVAGHISNIKGILFEQEYVNQLASDGIQAEIFEATNYPVTDIAIIEDDEVINELQLKATESVDYIQATLNEHPDIEIVATSGVANEISNDMVIDSGIEEAVLEEAVLDIVNPFSPLSVIGWLIGIF
jgi:hypothetical protein